MRRVLVVDDDPDIRELLRAELELDGFTVETANDGMAALELLVRADEVWVVLLDINMPRMTGLEVCEHLSAMGGLPAQHLVVLMTAGFFPDGDAPPPVRALLPKPFDLDAVRNIVARLAQEDTDRNDEPESGIIPATADAVVLLERRAA